MALYELIKSDNIFGVGYDILVHPHHPPAGYEQHYEESGSVKNQYIAQLTKFTKFIIKNDIIEIYSAINPRWPNVTHYLMFIIDKFNKDDFSLLISLLQEMETTNYYVNQYFESNEWRIIISIYENRYHGSGYIIPIRKNKPLRIDIIGDILEIDSDDLIKLHKSAFSKKDWEGLVWFVNYKYCEPDVKKAL